MKPFSSNCTWYYLLCLCKIYQLWQNLLIFAIRAGKILLSSSVADSTMFANVNRPQSSFCDELRVGCILRSATQPKKSRGLILRHVPSHADLWHVHLTSRPLLVRILSCHLQQLCWLLLGTFLPWFSILTYSKILGMISPWSSLFLCLWYGLPKSFLPFFW